MFARSDDSDDSQELTHIYPAEDSALERDGSRLAQRSLSVAHAAACSSRTTSTSPLPSAARLPLYSHASNSSLVTRGRRIMNEHPGCK